MQFTIRDWRTGEILHEGEAENFRAFVEKNKQNLQGAYLGDANLGDANLGDANLYGANLWGAHLKRADLRGASLERANLWGAYLGGAYLRNANLREANLVWANLGEADLRGASLYGANLYGANLETADLGDADLRGANLEDSRISIYSKQNILIKLFNSNIEKQDINKILINIGCEEKTIAEWDKWFASDEEYETKRGTFEFKQIQALYKAYRAYAIELWS